MQCIAVAYYVHMEQNGCVADEHTNEGRQKRDGEALGNAKGKKFLFQNLMAIGNYI